MADRSGVEPLRTRRLPRPDDASPDDEVLALAKQGDADAYGILVRRYQRDVLRAAAAMAGVAASDDVAQEAFVRAYRFLRSHRAGAPFRPWLLAIVANVARNHCRARSRWIRASQREATDPRMEDPEERALAGSHRRELWSALRALPERQREVVVCRYLLDLSEAETAHVLRVPRGTVKSRLSRAFEQLERTLSSEVIDD